MRDARANEARRGCEVGSSTRSLFLARRPNTPRSKRTSGRMTARSLIPPSKHPHRREGYRPLVHMFCFGILVRRWLANFVIFQGCDRKRLTHEPTDRCVDRAGQAIVPLVLTVRKRQY